MSTSTARPSHQFRADFTGMLRALACPEAFPFALPASEPLVVQTHASAVLLAGDRVYKLKKPVNLGFLDYSTPVLRRRSCILEVQLNARLSPRVYLGVAPVLALPCGALRVGRAVVPEQVPAPGKIIGDGEVVDYAVVMVRLPEKATLAARVAAGTATPELLAQVARRVAAFHASSPADAHIARFGGLDVIRANWEENFTQTQPYVGRALDAATFDHIAAYVQGFTADRAALFSGRVRDGYIRDCHGDLRLEHVYALGNRTDPGADLAIVDCIEFNERFRYGDVAGEVAFLAMELDAAGRHDLARAFVDTYVVVGGDDALRELLPFYACYRAFVRGKVLAFRLDEPEVPEEQREAARRQAGALFRLAARYANRPVRPEVVLLGGLMGTGKSTLARELARELGWALFSSDQMRKQLAQLDPAQPQPERFGGGIYTPAWTRRTYRALLDQAAAALAGGRSVLLDATFTCREDRQAAARMAAEHGAAVTFVECVCPRDVALQRLAARWTARTRHSHEAGQPGGTGDDGDVGGKASAASDGRPALYAAQRAAWEPFSAADEPGVRHVRVDTSAPVAASLEAALGALGMHC